MATVAQILTAAPIAANLASTAIQNGVMFGNRPLDNQLHKKILSTYLIINKIYENSGIVGETDATGLITINSTTGTNLEALVNDPLEGSISLGSYTKQVGDTTASILATSIAATLNANAYNYLVSAALGVISITAPNGRGATMNTGNRLSVTATVVAETRARVFLSPSRISTGTVFSIVVNDPVLGITTIATYTQQAGDSTEAIFIGNMITAINTNIYGYTCVTYLANTAFYIYATVGLGATINGNVGAVTWSGGSNTDNFSGGVTAQSLIDNTLTQFSGGVTEVPPTTALIKCANYLWELEGPYGIRAGRYLGITGGQVSPVSPPFSPYPIEFYVTADTLIPTGSSTVTLNGSNGTPDLRGYNLAFYRGTFLQGQLDPGGGGTYCAWNRVTGVFTLLGGYAPNFGAAVVSELFQLNPYL